MTLNKRFSSLALLMSMTLSLSAMAEVSPDVAATLNTSLTPIGAERAASTDGKIPAWQGGLKPDSGTVSGAGFLSDPYASEKPLFIITPANAQQYAANLSPGQLALLKRYPDSFQIPVYPTHRSVGIPEAIRTAVAHNATSVVETDEGNGIQNFQGAIAFPVPRNGLEVIWNHITRYRGNSFSLTSVSAAPQINGDYTPVTLKQRFTLRDKLTDFVPGQAENILFYYRQEITAPARQAGDVLLVHETIDQVKEPRLAWIYSAGQRRVRRAPDAAYDASGTSSAGLRTADNRDMFNGAPDRYNWQLVGKRELYIPYNSYRLASPTLKYDDIIKPGHIAPQYTRYELHRVWEVVATLKPGARHIYSKRHFFIDEDTWSIAEVDQYDSRGELWRVGESHAYFRYNDQIPTTAMEVFYDLISGRYIASGMTNQEPNAFDFGYKAGAADYTPGALRSSGVR